MCLEGMIMNRKDEEDKVGRDQAAPSLWTI